MDLSLYDISLSLRLQVLQRADNIGFLCAVAAHCISVDQWSIFIERQAVHSKKIYLLSAQ